MSTALLIVDFQNDFLPGGALAVEGGHQCQPVISRLARLPEVSVIALSRDWHPPNHVSFSKEPEYKDYSWPDHCVQGTRGAEFDEVLAEDLENVNKPQIIVTKGDDPATEAYSAFDGTTPVEEEDHWDDDWGGPPIVERAAPLGVVLDQIYGIDRVLVTGLALDYCVNATALDAVKQGLRSIVVIEATRPVAYETGVVAVDRMARHGVKFLSASELGVAA